MKYIFFLLLAASVASAQNTSATESVKKKQQQIIDQYLDGCALKHNYRYEMHEYQHCLEEGLKQDNTIAYLWQQKAMPYFKARKYEIGMEYIDKAVSFDAARWQPYRAFIKCIFAKTYREAIVDFEDCRKKFGNSYVMDHTFGFYIGLCHLQLNEFEKAEAAFKEYNDDLYQNRQKLEHPTALFYYGIAKYELGKFSEAIAEFDKALAIYPQFSDVKYYKAVCLSKMGKKSEVSLYYNQAMEDAKNGYSINEDNVIYETYPYQIIWPKG